MEHGNQEEAVNSTPVYSANGTQLNFPLAEYSQLKYYDTDKVLAAVCDFVCFSPEYMKKYLTRCAVMVRMSGYKKKEMDSMECFIDAIIELVDQLKEANLKQTFQGKKRS